MHASSSSCATWLCMTLSSDCCLLKRVRGLDYSNINSSLLGMHACILILMRNMVVHDPELRLLSLEKGKGIYQLK